MKGIRSFIAIEIPVDFKEALGRIQRTLGSAEVKVRWVDHRNIHLTTKFLGDVQDSDVPVICEVIKSAASGVEPFELEIAGLGFFPPKGPPRIIWAGIKGQIETLEKLVGEIDEGISREVGIRPESRRYHPHLTLGRVKSTRGAGRMAELMRESEAVEIGKFSARAVTLFMSELTAAGAVHTPMAEIKLGE